MALSIEVGDPCAHSLRCPVTFDSHSHNKWGKDAARRNAVGYLPVLQPRLSLQYSSSGECSVQWWLHEDLSGQKNTLGMLRARKGPMGNRGSLLSVLEPRSKGRRAWCGTAILHCPGSLRLKCPQSRLNLSGNFLMPSLRLDWTGRTLTPHPPLKLYQTIHSEDILAQIIKVRQSYRHLKWRVLQQKVTS